MNEEIAIDPAYAPAPRELRRWMRTVLGPLAGKYVSNFPSNWFDRYEQSVGIENRHLITEIRRQGQFVFDFGRAYMESDSWGTNVARSSKQRPFYATASGPNNHFGLPCISDDTFLDRLDTQTRGVAFHPLTAAPYVDICRVLIGMGPEVILVDPYLRQLNDQRHRRHEVIAALLDATKGTRCTDFVVIARSFSAAPGETGLADDNVVVRQFDETVQAASKRQCKVSLLLVNDRKRGGKVNVNLHQRLLLTKHGGISFDRGFELAPKGVKNSALLLDENLHHDAVQTYITERPSWGDVVARRREWKMPLAAK